MNSFWVNNFPVDQAIIHHEIGPEPNHPTLERLVKDNVNRLAEGGTSSWEMLNLNTQILNFAYHCWHHVAMIGIKEMMGVMWLGAVAM